jgi:quercetin dioxygenase-like cupin family protein
MQPQTSFHIVHANETRRTETPNATMTTLASPTLSGPTAISLWRVEFSIGASGPVHVMDSEQIWTVTSGTIVCIIDEDLHTLTTGDTILIAGKVTRQFVATTNASLVVCGKSDALASTPANSDQAITPPWIA